MQICEKQLFTIPTRILSMVICIQNLVSFCQFVLKILSKNRILTSIKGSNSVVILRKTKIYNTNIDLVNDNVYTNFGLNLFIFVKILSKNQILTSIKNGNSVTILQKAMIYDTNIDLVNDNVYTKFNPSIRFQNIEQKLNSDDDPRGVANLDPTGIIGRIYVEYHLTLLHTKYTSFRPCGFREDF